MAPAGPHGSRRRCAPPHHEGLSCDFGLDHRCAARPRRKSSRRIMGKRAAAFSKLDAKALALLQPKNAFFFGSNPTFYRGNDGVQAYFERLPRWRSPSVQFTDVRTAQAAVDVINVAGTASFFVSARHAGGGRGRVSGQAVHGPASAPAAGHRRDNPAAPAGHPKAKRKPKPDERQGWR